MTLADREIRLALASKSLIKRLKPSGGAFASTSVDLNLDPILKEFRSISSESKEVEIGEPNGYDLIPGKLILAWTAEYIDPQPFPRLAARVEEKGAVVLGR